MARVLVTGAAGFIGSHVAGALLDRGDEVVGIDNLNDYYDPALKRARLARLEGRTGFSFHLADITDAPAVEEAFDKAPTRVVHLAAQAGVRHSLSHPHDYIAANISGTLNILEACRHRGTEHLVYASSSSVYGGNGKLPFSIHDSVDHPLSLYGATKKSNELMAHVYSHLFGVPTTGLRFFTVYGPWGRPDMALFLFTAAILAGEPIDVFNRGEMARAFTYIDDIVAGVLGALDRTAEADASWSALSPDPATSAAPYRIYNIGCTETVGLMTFINAIEHATGRTAIVNLLPMQPGDVPATSADIEDLARDVGFTPSTPVEEGVRAFVDWYRGYYR